MNIFRYTILAVESEITEHSHRSAFSAALLSVTHDKKLASSCTSVAEFRTSIASEWCELAKLASHAADMLRERED